MTGRQSAKLAKGSIEPALILIALLLFSEALLGRLFASEQNPEGGVFLRFLWLPIYAYAAIAVSVRWRSFLTICSKSPALVILSLLAFVSAAWSIDPSTSFRRGIAILFTTFFGFYLASALSWKDLLRLLGVVWLILALGNLIAGGLVPSFGVMYEIHVGAWRGLWFEKNAMGGNFARASFLFGFLVMMDTERRKMWAFGLLASIMLVLLSTSKTSLLGLCLGMALLMLFLWMKQGRVISAVTVWFIVTAIASVAFIFFVQPEILVQILGRDLTLTGRTDIWEVLFGLIEDRPMLGYGYGAFWGEESVPANAVRRATEWPVPTAHNGLIEVLLALGWLGGGLLLVDYLINLCRAVFTLNSRTTSLFAVGSLLLFALFSISESIALQQNSLIWVSYVTIASKLALEASQRSRVVKPTAPRSRIRTQSKETPLPLRGRFR
ncbi:MAG: polymerase [Ponticaulis sp.]|nr:polymerase [Ponticaulis sp.]